LLLRLIEGTCGLVMVEVGQLTEKRRGQMFKEKSMCSPNILGGTTNFFHQRSLTTGARRAMAVPTSKGGKPTKGTTLLSSGEDVGVNYGHRTCASH
jgi:hypothetical protein